MTHYESIAGERPAGTKAAIVAELHEIDRTQRDHRSRITRRVVIGWSLTARESFRELRRMAVCFSSTAPLADAPPDAENRDKHSQGAGFYLGEGHEGWSVRKDSYGLDRIVAALAAPAEPTHNVRQPLRLVPPLAELPIAVAPAPREPDILAAARAVSVARVEAYAVILAKAEDLIAGLRASYHGIVAEHWAMFGDTEIEIEG